MVRIFDLLVVESKLREHDQEIFFDWFKKLLSATDY